MNKFLMTLLGNKKSHVPLPAPWSDQRVAYVDIGARGGPPDNWLKLSNMIDYFCFEPDEEEAVLLRRQFDKKKSFHAVVVQKALAASEGKGLLQLTKFRPSSSLLKPNKKVVSALAVGSSFEVEATAPVVLGSLDEEMTRLGARCDFIKADVQGYELEVLKGAERSLDEISGCELEVSFIEIYENQPLLAEIDQYMRLKGFFLADLERVWWRRASAPLELQERGAMAYANATYLKNEITSPPNRENALRNTIVCVAVGLDEIAYEIVDAGSRARLFTAQEKQDFDVWHARRHRSTAFWTRLARKLSILPGRQTMGRWLGLWSRALGGDSDTRSDSESWLRRNSW